MSPAASVDDWVTSASKATPYYALSLVQAAQATIRHDADWKRQFLHLAMRRERRIAKVAMARKLAVHLFWMWRRGWDYQQFTKFGSHAGKPGHSHGVQ